MKNADVPTRHISVYRHASRCSGHSYDACTYCLEGTLYSLTLTVTLRCIKCFCISSVEKKTLLQGKPVMRCILHSGCNSCSQHDNSMGDLFAPCHISCQHGMYVKRNQPARLTSMLIGKGLSSSRTDGDDSRVFRYAIGYASVECMLYEEHQQRDRTLRWFNLTSAS